MFVIIEIGSCSFSVAGYVIFIPGQSASFWSVMESPHILSSVPSRKRRSASSCRLHFSYIIYSSDAELTLSVYARRSKEIKKLWSDMAKSTLPVKWIRVTDIEVTMQSHFRVDFLTRQEGSAANKTGYFAVDQISFTGCVFAGQFRQIYKPGSTLYFTLFLLEIPVNMSLYYYNGET